MLPSQFKLAKRRLSLNRLITIAIASCSLNFAIAKPIFSAAINFPPRAVVIAPAVESRDDRGDRFNVNHDQNNSGNSLNTGSGNPNARVTEHVVNVLGSTTDKKGKLWYYVQFLPSQAEGWVEAEYVLFEEK
jgi:hypothetical protein